MKPSAKPSSPWVTMPTSARWLAFVGLGMVLLSPFLFPALKLAGWSLFFFGVANVFLSVASLHGWRWRK